MPAFKVPKILINALVKVGLHKPEPPTMPIDSASSDADELCCDGGVHIFYRGVSDDRLYKSADRHWREVKYFRQNGLKVFCKQCRRRLF
jgi:hypothetical protein